MDNIKQMIRGSKDIDYTLPLVHNGGVAKGFTFTGLYSDTAISIGNSTTALTLSASNDRAIEIYTTTAAAVVQPFYMKTTMTTAAATGGRAQFHLTANVALGGWSNAIKGYVEYGASGRTAGLGSAVCAEILLSAGTTSGTYAPLESELVINADTGKTGTSTSFLYGNIAGTSSTGKTTINTNGYFFELGVGVVTTTDGMFEEVTVTAAQVFDAALKVKVGGVDYFIGLCDDKSFA